MQYLKTQQIKRMPWGDPEGKEENHLSWLRIEGKYTEVLFPLMLLGTPNLPPPPTGIYFKKKTVMERVNRSSQQPRNTHGSLIAA